MAKPVDDVRFDYDEIYSGCRTMATKLSAIAHELVTLEGTVSGLLHNGLVFEKASPAMQDAYREFSRQMKSSANGIHSFADSFKKIAQSMSESDSQIASEIKKAMQNPHQKGGKH